MSQEAAGDKYSPRLYRWVDSKISTIFRLRSPIPSEPFEETIAVLVGPEEGQQRFTVHKHLICASSKFFNAACSKLWLEGKEKLVRLPEVKVETFRAYVVWVYAGKIAVNKSNLKDEFRQTVGLYLLGDILDDLVLRDEAMKTMVTKPMASDGALVGQIWDSTTLGSRLRQMIVDAIIMGGTRNKQPGDLSNYPKELLQTLTVSLLGRVPTVSKEKFVAGLGAYLEQSTSGASQEK